jgi:uncharacterized lipoprotein YmbA
VRSQCQRNGTTFEHASPDIAAYIGETQSALIVRARLAFSVINALFLVACGSQVSSVDAIGYELGPNAVLVPGGAQEVGLGRTQSSAIPALVKLAGPIKETREDAVCNATQTLWADGLIANFQNRTFVGWQSADGRSAGVVCSA